MTNKFLILATLALVIALLAGGIYYPDTLMMSLADTSIQYTVLRGVVVVLLVSLLVTHPPRSLALRSVIGAGALVLSIVSVQSLLSYQLRLLDAIVFFEIALIFAIEALEARTIIPVSKKHSPAKKIPVFTN